jgi:hypothetical protein
VELSAKYVIETGVKSAMLPPSRNVLILSPYFPPSTLAGVHRARHLAKHLPMTGWTPIVLCVDEAYQEERLDPGLAALVPSSTEVIKVAAISAKLARSIGVGEISLRAWRPLRRELMRLLGSRKIDAVLITGSPYYPMLLAPAIKRHYGVPVVLDFQDPWVSSWGATQPKFSKLGLSHRLATLLEPLALRGSDYVTTVSNGQSADLVVRYPWLNRARMAAVPIGGDPDDFVALRAEPPNADDLSPGVVNLSFVGTFMPRSTPLIRTLLCGFRRFLMSDSIVASRIRLNFIGTSNQPNERASFCVLPIAEQIGVAQAVREIPQRLPYLRALGILARSDGILLIGSDEPHYTASKIYPALMSGRPFLSLFHRASGSHALLKSSGGGLTLAFDTYKELVALEGDIANCLRTLVVEPERLGRADPAAYASFTAHAVAGRFAAIFNRVTARA